MKMKMWLELGAKFAALTIILFTLYAIDFVNGRWGDMMTTAPLMLLVVALLDTAVLTMAIHRLRYHGWQLAGAIFLLFYGVKTFLVGIEAVYLSDVLTPPMARSLFLNGLIVAALFTPIAVRGFGRWTGNTPAVVPAKTTKPTLRIAVRWLGRLLLAGILYLILFIAGGLLLFTPIANALDPIGAAAYLAGFSAPDWLPLFIIIRGSLWGLLALPVIWGLNGRFWPNGLLLGLLFAVLMADNLLLPTTIPAAMRVAHFIELFVENMLFGLVLVWLLGWPRRQQVLAPSFRAN